VPNPPALELIHTAQVITPFLILHAFASGTTAMTGIEAVSDGIQAFQQPRSRNAGITLLWMGFILSTLFLGISFLAVQIGAIPSEGETVISQIARTAYNGQGWLYLITLASTTAILIMATNTAFADFPRLSSWLAIDGFLPRQLNYRGSRLVFSRGIVGLAILASLLVTYFQASVTKLIPLYAIGVFLSFTLSQGGMAYRWWKIGHLSPNEERQERGSMLRYEAGWQYKMVINGFGSFCTAIVTLVFAYTKFWDGAWVVLLLIPALVSVFSYIYRHYQNLRGRLSLKDYTKPRRITRRRVIVAVAGVHRGTIEALNYAQSLSDDVTGVHVSIDPVETEKVQHTWEEWSDGTRLVILESPHRLLYEPLLAYIKDVLAVRQPNETITIIVPQFVPKRWWDNLLHHQTALRLRWNLLSEPGIVVTDVPYQV